MVMPKGNVLLRRTQYRWADDEERSVSVARLMIAAKVGNCRAVLMREQRNHGASDALAHAAEKLAALLENIRHARNMPQLMGLEGEAASVYFGASIRCCGRTGLNFRGEFADPPAIRSMPCFHLPMSCWPANVHRLWRAWGWTLMSDFCTKIDPAEKVLHWI